MNAHPPILNIKKCTACYVSKCLPWIIKHTSCSGCFHCAAAVWVYSKIWNQIWTQSMSFLYQKIWVFGRAAVLNLNDSKTVRIYSGCFSTPLSQDLTHDFFFSTTLVVFHYFPRWVNPVHLCFHILISWIILSHLEGNPKQIPTESRGSKTH